MGTTFNRISDWDDARWRDRAACRDSDPDLFFPAGSTGAALEEIRAAKALCAICPVHDRCLAYALATNQDAGIWGGASEEERRELRRQAARKRPRPYVLR